jgi:hypothetical protein
MVQLSASKYRANRELNLFLRPFHFVPRELERLHRAIQLLVELVHPILV